LNSTTLRGARGTLPVLLFLARIAPRRPMAEQNGNSTGRIVEIKGVVLDAVFPNGLPDIYSALSIQVPGRDAPLIAEVQQHLGDDRVRAVAMDSTDGLSRGTDVPATGEAISVPVGPQTLERIWTVH